MIQVTGVLKDPLNQVASNTPIRVVTKTGFGDTLTGSSATYSTDATGSYDFPLVTGTHTIDAQFGDQFVKLGYCVVNSETPTTVTISELLEYTSPLTPAEIALIKSLTEQVTESAANAKASETASAGSAQDAKNSAAEASEVSGLNTVTEAVDLALGDSHQFMRTEADLEAMRSQNNEMFAASGFVHEFMQVVQL